jgi:hypothetical protein
MPNGRADRNNDFQSFIGFQDDNISDLIMHFFGFNRFLQQENIIATGNSIVPFSC